jgi:hypothetical protein
MTIYYGDSAEEVKLANLIKRIEKGEKLSNEDIEFVKEKIADGKPRKFWRGADFYKNALQKLKERYAK